MFDNHLYNLMNQLTQEHKSLYRIKDMYLNDSDGCEDCEGFWNRMIKDKEEHIEELSEMIAKHMN